MANAAGHGMQMHRKIKPSLAEKNHITNNNFLLQATCGVVIKQNGAQWTPFDPLSTQAAADLPAAPTSP